MREESAMKSKTLKLLRIAPRLRREVESVLAKGETLSAFIFDSVARNVGFRRTQQLFIARGLASGERARKTGRYVPADAVISKLSSRLTKAHAKSAPDGYTLLMAQPAFTVNSTRSRACASPTCHTRAHRSPSSICSADILT